MTALRTIPALLAFMAALLVPTSALAEEVQFEEAVEVAALEVPAATPGTPMVRPAAEPIAQPDRVVALPFGISVTGALGQTSQAGALLATLTRGLRLNF